MPDEGDSLSLSEDALWLLETLKRCSLGANPWPFGLTLDDFICALPSEFRLRSRKAVEELCSAKAIELRLIDAEWSEVRKIHPRDWNDQRYIHWTPYGEALLARIAP